MPKKQTCPECLRILRTRCFVYNPLKENFICTRCHNKIGTNKFYTPNIKLIKKKKFQKYNFKKDERNFIQAKYNLTYEESKDKIKNIKKIVDDLSKTKFNEKKMKEKLNEKFLKGLKQR